MSEQEKAFLRAIILSHEPRTEAKIYADWLDDEQRAEEAAKFRRARKPKSWAYKLIAGGRTRWWLAESPQAALKWRSNGEAATHAKFVRRLTGLPAKSVLIASIAADHESQWGVLIAGGWHCHHKPSLWMQA